MIASTSFGSSFASSSASFDARSARSEVASPSAITRRSRIPVRSTIHWSFVSTSFSRSAFVRIFSGANEPVPTMRERIGILRWSGAVGGAAGAGGIWGGGAVACGDSGGLGEERLGRRDRLGDLVGEVRAGGVARATDRVLDRERVGAAVADDAHAVHAHERRAPHLAPVHALLHSLERRPREQAADLRAQGGVERALQVLADDPRRALHRLQGHVAGEAVGRDDVELAGEEVAPLAVPDEVDGGATERRRRSAGELGALRLLLALREDRDPR